MDAEPVDPQEQAPSDDASGHSDPNSEEVAETIAEVHIEGKGLDADIEQRYEND